MTTTTTTQTFDENEFESKKINFEDDSLINNSYELNKLLINQERERLMQLYEEGLREYKLLVINLKSILKEMKLTLQYFVVLF
jgi:hypothetical protein